MNIERLLEERRGVVLRSELRAIGVDPIQLRGEVRARVWRAEGRKILIHSSAPADRITDILVAAAWHPECIVTGPSAALLNPHPAFSDRDFSRGKPMIIATRSRPGPCRMVSHPGATYGLLHGVRVADHHTTLIDLLRFLPWDDAAAVAGAAGQRRLTTGDALLASMRTLTRAAGAAQLRLLIRAMIKGAESGTEVDLQQSLYRAQIKGWVGNPTLQFGDRIYRPDIAFLREKVALEYDGMLAHSGEAAFHHDRERMCGMQFADWQVYPITKETLYDSAALAAFLGRLRAKLRERRGDRY